MLRYAPLSWLHALWDAMTKLTQEHSDVIPCRYAHFLPGTPISTVEDWISSLNPAFVLVDVQSGIREERQLIITEPLLLESRVLDPVIAPFIENEAMQRYIEARTRGFNRKYAISSSDVCDALVQLEVKRLLPGRFSPTLIARLIQSMHCQGYPGAFLDPHQESLLAA